MSPPYLCCCLLLPGGATLFDEVDEKLQMGSAVGGIEVKSCTYCFCDLKDVGRSDAAGFGYFGRPCVVSCGLSLSVPCRHRGRFSAGCDNRHLNLILAHFFRFSYSACLRRVFFAEPRIFLNRLQAAQRLRGESYDDGMSANCTAGQVVRWHNAARHMPISCNFSRLWSSDVVKSTKVQSKSEAVRIKSESSWSPSESLGVHSKSYDYESQRESSHTHTHTV